MKFIKLIKFSIICTIIFASNNCYCQFTDTIASRFNVTLREAHKGSVEIDTSLLDSYEQVPENIGRFYLDSRFIFFNTSDANFSNTKIIVAAREHDVQLMGGPMLGDLKDNRVTLWLRPSTAIPLNVKVVKADGTDEKSYIKEPVEPGIEQRIRLDGLFSGTAYNYGIYAEKRKIAEGKFTTAPSPGEKMMFKLAFGSCLHKISFHNPNRINQILKSKPDAMMLLGDIAVDDRENRINMHRSDYLLRDLSKPWQRLVSNVSIFSSWDDHDYLNNDLSDIPDKFTKADQKALRAVWDQNWNNPENKADGIYFNTRIGPLELIMLDTRSCIKVEERESTVAEEHTLSYSQLTL